MLENPHVEAIGDPLDLSDVGNSLKSLMWRNVGVRRDAEGLGEGMGNINRWSRYVSARQFTDPTGWELQNMLCVARLMTQAALIRQETRGAHVRTDFPEADDEHWNRHTTFRRDAEQG
ncbi:MAG: L-aspartate oxidase, partial [Planctomycetota bacterium]|jgi:L-aspartate oxidase